MLTRLSNGGLLQRVSLQSTSHSPKQARCGDGYAQKILTRLCRASSVSTWTNGSGTPPSVALLNPSTSQDIRRMSSAPKPTTDQSVRRKVRWCPTPPAIFVFHPHSTSKSQEAAFQFLNRQSLQYKIFKIYLAASREDIVLQDIQVLTRIVRYVTSNWEAQRKGKTEMYLSLPTRRVSSTSMIGPTSIPSQATFASAYFRSTPFKTGTQLALQSSSQEGMTYSTMLASVPGASHCYPSCTRKPRGCTPT